VPVDPPSSRNVEGQQPSLRIAVLISGSGRSLANLLTVIADGALDAEIVAVVSSVAGVRGLEIATDAGVPATTIARKGFADNAAYSAAVYGWLRPYRPDLIALAGFLRKLEVPPEWAGRILNIHPALAAAFPYASGRGFYGDRVHAAVLANGDETAVPVLPGDTAATLGARVFAAECALYPVTIRSYVAAHPDLFGKRP